MTLTKSVFRETMKLYKLKDQVHICVKNEICPRLTLTIAGCSCPIFNTF